MKGQIAKEYVKDQLIQIFGQDYIGEFDKKHYIWVNDGGEKIQIAVALTCPKVYKGVDGTTPTVLNFEDDDISEKDNHPSQFEPASISQEEQDTLQDLMNKLGL